MFIRDLVNADELPALEQSLRFSAQKQRVLNHNIANIDTPGFQPLEVSVGGFRQSLSRAVEARREQWGGVRGDLEWRETRELQKNARGELELNPTTPGRNILFQDRNNRSLERLMQQVQENNAEFSSTVELMRSKMELLRTAITETR